MGHSSPPPFGAGWGALLRVGTSDVGDGLPYRMFHNDCYKANQYFIVKSWCVFYFLYLCFYGYIMGNLVVVAFNTFTPRWPEWYSLFQLVTLLTTSSSLDATTRHTQYVSALSPGLLNLQRVLVLLHSGDQLLQGGQGSFAAPLKPLEPVVQ